jgi:ribosomal protein S18 acetylase RimI-like enzyme
MRRERSMPIIRRAEERDIGAIAALWKDLFDLHAELDPIFQVAEDGENAYRVWLQGQLDMPDNFFHIAEAEGRVIAFCQSQIKVLPPMLVYRRIGVIADMAVDQAWRGRGVGRRLYQYVETRLHRLGADRIELKTSSFNAQSNHFWQKVCGFNEFVKIHFKAL